MIDKDFYDQHGYLILPQFFSTEEVSTLKRLAESVWEGPRNPDLVVDIGEGKYANQRMKLAKAPAECAAVIHKVADLYLVSDEFRKHFLGRKLVEVLAACVEGSPLIINSLNFIQGSTQRAHFDTWYMPPPVEDAMVVASLALEDYREDNGPVFYYPGSHKLPKYRFSTGHIRAVEAEMPACDASVFPAVEKAGLEKKVLLCKAGDLFVWHSQLLHGGSPIQTPGATRRSIVVHYWRNGDIETTDEYPWLRGLSKPAYAGFYLDRPHQTPGEVVKA